MVVNVNPGISTTDQRGQGFEEGVKGKPGVSTSARSTRKDDPAIAADIVTATLAKHPDLKGIFAANLFSAEGAASGLRQAGKLGDVKIVGFDAGPKQVEDLKDGLVQALIAQKPADIGTQGVEQAYNALEGKPTEEKIGTGAEVITKDNLVREAGRALQAELLNHAAPGRAAVRAMRPPALLRAGRSPARGRRWGSPGGSRR